jgi:hypothetical protein
LPRLTEIDADRRLEKQRCHRATNAPAPLKFPAGVQ